jgi:hypothetical protein
MHHDKSTAEHLSVGVKVVGQIKKDFRLCLREVVYLFVYRGPKFIKEERQAYFGNNKHFSNNRKPFILRDNFFFFALISLPREKKKISTNLNRFFFIPLISHQFYCWHKKERFKCIGKHTTREREKKNT